MLRGYSGSSAPSSAGSGGAGHKNVGGFGYGHTENPSGGVQYGDQNITKLIGGSGGGGGGDDKDNEEGAGGGGSGGSIFIIAKNSNINNSNISDISNSIKIKGGWGGLDDWNVNKNAINDYNNGCCFLNRN